MRLEFLFSLPVTTLASTALAQRPIAAPRYTLDPDAPTTWDDRLLTHPDGTPSTTEDYQIITLSPTADYTPLNASDVLDDSPTPRRLGFFGCDCRETVSMWGDERIYQHTCEFEGYNYDDIPYVLETAIGMYIVGLEYVGKPSKPPSMAYIVPPNSHFIDRFQYQLTCSEIKLGSHFLSYLVRDLGQTNQIPCYFNHTHIPADSPTYTSFFWAMSDFMSGVSGPQNTIDPNFYMTTFLKYMFGYPLEAWPFLVSAGNYIGGDPWDVNPVNHETPFLMNQFSEFRILNVGNLELPYGQAYLDKVSSVHGVSSYISSNIYYKTGHRAFKQYRQWRLDAPTDTVNVELVFFGLMTEQSKRLLPTHVLDTFDIRTDLEREIAAIDHDCFVIKNTTYGTKCVLLVSGGFSPNYAHDPAEEIEANLTEFAKIVNTLPTFDGFVGSQTMVSGTVLLPNERWVMQGLPRGQLINRIGLTRAKRQDMYTAPTIKLSPIDGSEDIPEVPGTWPSDIEGAWAFLYDRQLDVAKRIVPLEEIGVFQGSIPLFKDISNPRTCYTAESPIATAIADAIRTTSNADIAIVEGNIAAHGLYPPHTDDGDDSEEGDPNMKETVLTNRHLRELLHRNNSRSVVLKITPSQLFEVLNEQWQPETGTTNLFRPLAFSNMKAGFDARRPMSSKVVYIEVNGARFYEDDEDTVFTLITTDYLRGGPIGHSVLRGLPDYSDENSESDNQADEVMERKAVAVVVGATPVDREEETTTTAAADVEGILSGVKEAVKSNLRAIAKAAGAVPPLKEYSISDFDGLYIRDLFARHVANYPISEPLPRQENSTVVVPRDAAVHVSYPVKAPESPEDPFPVQLHFTANGDRTLEGPFNVYRRDTSENLGQIAEISKEDPAVLVFDTYLSKLSQLVTVYVTHSLWEDQSYQRELAFAISLPGLSTGEESSDDDESTSTVAPTVARTASAGLNIAFGLSCCCISLMTSLII